MAVAQRTWYDYGATWPDTMSRIDALVWMIRQGGFFVKEGVKCGIPLFDCYLKLDEQLWPNYDRHDWYRLNLKTILENRITAIQGPKDCGKTNIMARYALLDYFCFPKETLILMSSTDLRGLELRVYGEVKDLFNQAKEVWPECPGNVVDSLHGIFTDSVENDDGKARDIRRGLICIPVLDSQGQWKGLSKFAGVKQKRRRVLSDEVQFYPQPYLTALSNLDKGDFKGVFAGNPIGEGDPLDKLAEPEDGWDSLPDIEVTTSWKNKFGGVTVQLVGSDSPAIRFPGQFLYMINQQDIDRIVSRWGKESAEYWNQAAGIRRPGVSLRRIVTMDMIKQFEADGPVYWKDGQTTKIYAVDAGYGGDRCVGGSAEFGLDINGRQVLHLSTPRLIPIRLYPKSVPVEERLLPEDQIAEFVKADCEAQGIPASNVFHDSTGRGSLGTSFARLWRSDCNPVEFGGSPTPRPVRADEMIYDEKLRKKRLKRCDEHYSKRVSELHFSVRYTIEGRQMRGLPLNVANELCSREWTRVRKDLIEVETKEETKERLGRSPDLGDWCAIIVEGARRLGFQISRMEGPEAEEEKDERWKEELRQRSTKFRKSFSLSTA